MASERVTHWILINFSTTAPTKSAHSILPQDLGKAPKTTRKVHISLMSLGVPGGVVNGVHHQIDSGWTSNGGFNWS